jgi:hypothetical protein
LQSDLTIQTKGGEDICMPRRPSLAFVIRFLRIRISPVDQLIASNALLELHIYLNRFGIDVPSCNHMFSIFYIKYCYIWKIIHYIIAI